MATAYLVGASVGLWFTKQALRPVRLPAYRAIPSFFAGWLTNELAFHHLAWQVVTAAAFVRSGALRHARGRVALGITLVQWLGTVELIRRIVASRKAVQVALDEALAGFGEEPDEVEGESRALRWAQIVAPFPIRHADVVRQRGIVFSRAGGRHLALDVYRHRALPTGRPVLLYVHGGAWIISNRNEQGLPLMHEVAARGWVGVNADYRLSPAATFPDHLVDVKRAIAWIRAHADEIGADPGFVAIAGGSAGGHLASLAALTGNDPRYQAGFEDADTSVQACISFYGLYDLLDRDRHHGHDRFVEMLQRWILKSDPVLERELWEAASPIDQIRPDAPPFLIFHGDADTLSPVSTARAFAQRLRDVSDSPVGYTELPGTQHAFDVFPSLRSAYVLDGVATFLDRAWRHRRTLPGASLAGSGSDRGVPGGP